MKIKECPFCFSSEEHYVYLVNERNTVYIYCDNCGMRGATGYTDKEAINNWNKLRR